MIASIMYAAIGFLVASLGALFVIPLVHNRAVRLTSKRLETALPQSIAEIHAGRDQLRAEFAVSTRRLELKIDQLKNKAARYFAELGTKNGIIEKIEIERDAQQAENAALKAQIDALAVRSKEVIDQLKDKAESYLAELGNKGIVIDKLRIERNALQGETAALKAQVEALTAGGNEARADGRVDAGVPPDRPAAEMPTVPAEPTYGLTPGAHDHDGIAVSFVPNVWPVAELFQVPKDPPPANDQGRRDDTASSAAGEQPSAETASIADVPEDASQPSPPNDRRREEIASLLPRQGLAAAETVNVPSDGAHGPPPNDRQHRSDAVSDLLKRLKADEARSGGSRREPGAGRGSHGERIEAAGGRFDASDGSKTAAPPIRVSPGDGFAGNGRLTRRPALARFAAAVPIVAGASIAWHYHGQEAMEAIRTGIVSLGELSSVSTKSAPDLEVTAGQPRAAGAGRISAQNAAPQPTPRTAPAPTAATSPELVQGELQDVVRDLAALRHGVEQLTARHEQMAEDIATRQVAEAPVKHTVSVPRRPRREQLTPAPETRPITIAGWTLLEVIDDAVVLKGPNGTWTARRGDLVPGVGTVDSVVRWGNRWLVATSRGLISTP